MYLLCTIWCSVISTRPLIKGQGLRISPGYYEHDLQLCTFMGNKRKKEKRTCQLFNSFLLISYTWQLEIIVTALLYSFTLKEDDCWPLELVGVKNHVLFFLLFPSMVNSLCSEHNRDLELMSSLVSVRNCKSLLQSNICNLFLPGI